MTLQQYFRLIIISIFQKKTENYDNKRFYCPRIYCKNGFNISLQINAFNYCSTENGYRKLGLDYKTVEWGFPNKNEKKLWKSSELWDESAKDFDVTNSVGSIEIEKIQEIIDDNGGIDWDQTLDINNVKFFRR